jgi:hypothetical protein
VNHTAHERGAAARTMVTPPSASDASRRRTAAARSAREG